MRFVNAGGRAGFLVGQEVFDIERTSGGAIPADPMTVIVEHWRQALALHERGAFSGGIPVEQANLGPPVPAPRAIFGIGLNYRAHAAESGADLPQLPAVFTKFPTSVSGPHDDVLLPRDEHTTDWEAELAFVVGMGGRRISRDDAYDALAGFTVAQDISERRVQMAAGGQFSIGKSFVTFCPIGPAIVTIDEIPDPADLRITCRVSGELMQNESTTDLVFDVPALVEFLSSVLPLRAGDLCLTGTPAGVGASRNPPRFLTDGDVIETTITGLGDLRNQCVAEDRQSPRQ